MKSGKQNTFSSMLLYPAENLLNPRTPPILGDQLANDGDVCVCVKLASVNSSSRRTSTNMYACQDDKFNLSVSPKHVSELEDHSKRRNLDTKTRILCMVWEVNPLGRMHPSSLWHLRLKMSFVSRTLLFYADSWCSLQCFEYMYRS